MVPLVALKTSALSTVPQLDTAQAISALTSDNDAEMSSGQYYKASTIVNYHSTYSHNIL